MHLIEKREISVETERDRYIINTNVHFIVLWCFIYISKYKQKMHYLSAQIFLYPGCKNIGNFDAIQKQNGDIN